MDEILPEVKQKNQIGYLNCTVVNKGSESVVSTDLHNDHVSTMLNTALVLLNAIKDVYWKERGRCLIITGIRLKILILVDLKYMYIYISLADMPSMSCILICTLIYVFGHGYNCCYIGLDSSVIDSGRVPDMKKKGVLCSISRVAHGKFTFFLPWKCRFNSGSCQPDARLMYFLFLFIDYSEKLYIPACVSIYTMHIL